MTVKDMTYWAEERKTPLPKYHYGPSTTAVSIEMTAYALMAFTIAEDKITAAAINKWLVGQRSTYGGFVSTQVRQILYDCRFIVIIK